MSDDQTADGGDDTVKVDTSALSELQNVAGATSDDAVAQWLGITAPTQDS